MRTPFTDLVGCTLPIQLAAMGGVGTPELAAAVAGAGGLGMVPILVEPPNSSAGAIGANFLAVFEPDLDIVTEVARKVRVVEFFYAWPDRRLVDAVKAGGAIAAWQVGSVDEAQAAVDCGCGRCWRPEGSPRQNASPSCCDAAPPESGWGRCSWQPRSAMSIPCTLSD